MQKQILRLAIPNILTNLSVPLLSAVDTAMMGHMDDPEYLGAIAIGGMIFNFIYWGFGFLRMGTTGLTAQAYGNPENDPPFYWLLRAVIVAVIAGLFLVTVQTLLTWCAFAIVETEGRIETLAQSYFDIRIYAAPATLLLYAFNGWFLGMQNAKYPLYLSVFINLLNIGLNIIFVYQFNMYSDGVALGTLLAQYGGLAAALFLWFRRYRSSLTEIKLVILRDRDALTAFVTVNRDIFIRTLCLIFTFSYFTIKSAEYGAIVLAANSVLLQFWSILSYGIDGFAFAAESLVGRFIGERNPVDLKKSIRITFYWGFGMAIGLMAIFAGFPLTLLELFTDQELVIQAALAAYIWTIFAPLVNTACFIWDGIYIGATASVPMRNNMLMSTLLFLSVILALEGTLGNHALWLGMTVFMTGRGIGLSWVSKRHIYGHPRLIP